MKEEGIIEYKTDKVGSLRVRKPIFLGEVYMTERYRNFRELQACEAKNDYKIFYRPGKYSVLIMAPHGGEIEPFTSQISEWIAGEDFSIYLFEGIKDYGIKDLHITSHHFDEPLALEILERADIVVTIHSLRNSVDEFIMVGGLDLELCAKIKAALAKAGFEIRKCEARYRGQHPDNICNRGRQGIGVQLEITYALIKRIFMDLNCRLRFKNAMRSVLLNEILV